MGRIQPVGPLAYIPSPHSGVVDLGPFHLHAYGITLLVAIAACIWLTGRRWVRMGGDWDLVLRAAVWGVAAGIVGARAYHDITSWIEVPHKWWGPFAVWQGGLGVWGGILLGCLVGSWIVRRSRATFHPTFLYELIYDVIGVGLLLAVGRLFRIRPPALFALYVSYYTFGRFFEELLRIDPAHHFLGLRLNAWVSIVVFVCSTSFFVWWQFIRKGGDEPEQARTRPVPTGPAMAIPRGRVRSSR